MTEKENFPIGRIASRYKLCKSCIQCTDFIMSRIGDIGFARFQEIFESLNKVFFSPSLKIYTPHFLFDSFPCGAPPQALLPCMEQALFDVEEFVIARATQVRPVVGCVRDASMIAHKI